MIYIIKKNALFIVITSIISLGLWGVGFLSLNQPDWGGGVDRPVYVKAVENFFARRDLYPDPNQVLPKDLLFFSYSPMAVLSVGLFNLLSPEILYFLHLISVVALFFAWRTILEQVKIKIPKWITLIWFIFSPFIYDAVTLNVNIFMALLATLYLFFILRKNRYAKLVAVLSLFLIIITKPQWGFIVLLPLVGKRWKYFFEVIAGIIALYVMVFILASLLTEPKYIISQHILFVQHLATFSQRFTYWNLPPGPYEYNNSIHQVVIYLLGDIKSGLAIAKIIQAVLFMILAIIFSTVVFTKKTEENPEEENWRYLRWFFIFYCSTVLYPPSNFDFSLGLPMFIFLAAQGPVQKFFVGIPLVFVAFQDLIRLIMSSLFDISWWFPFVFTTTVISLIFLLTTKSPGCEDFAKGRGDDFSSHPLTM